MSNFLINTDKKLKKIIAEIQDSKYIGVDTEFVRESTYYPVLALIQISTKESIFCIDVLNIKDKTSLKKILSNRKITKIIHSSKQDLEALNSYFKSYPNNIFDTQIAANLVGLDMNISYSGIVKKLFNKDLKQGSWRTNWLERPLSEEKINYACNDVKYLLPIYQKLNKELIKYKRLSWFKEEQNKELKKENVIAKPRDSWKKINASPDLSRVQVRKIKYLAEWRERKAIKKNLPKRWVLLDNELTKLALSDEKRIKTILKNLKNDLSNSDEKMIISLTKKYSKSHDNVNSKSIKMRSRKQINECNKLLEKVAVKYKLPQSLIANKRELDMYAKNQKQIRFLEGWRFKIFGKLLQ